MLCAEVQGQQLVITGTATDPSQCQAVVVTGNEANLLSLFQFPDPADSGTVWGLGFTSVVVTYLFAWAAQAVLSSINKDPS